MDADELIEEFLAEHVNTIVINPISIIDARPDEEVTDYFCWLYLITTKLGPLQWYKEQELTNLQWLIDGFWITHENPFDNGDEPPGSVRSEFMNLPIHHTKSSKQCHYNSHTLDNTTAFRSIGHKHSDTVLNP